MKTKWMDNLYIIWTIASKDIVDALRNKLILSLILGMGFMLLMPKLMELMFVSPATPVLVYDPGESRLTAELEKGDQVRVRQARSLTEVEQIIGSMGFGLGVEFGLAVPEDFDQTLEAGGQLELDGYVAWANRMKADQFKTDFEMLTEELMGQPVGINLEGNTVYPPSDSGLWLLMITITPVTVILMMGISLVPTLLFEEKQTKTMSALLVSPASISQVVVGKALAGLFYVIVSAGVVFVINWAGVVHWEVALLFVLGIGVFGVGVGLVLGSFFERQQDVTGLTMLLLVVFIGALFVDMLGLDIPVVVQAMLPWVPSVALAKIIRFVFLESTPWVQVWTNLGSVLGISILLYGVVIWKIRREDQ
ncbi:MAG: ABC transporter permease [Gammaproteobacteria bacterium]|nr:ABC transporter permease [Gammaproteobacteria bacterium]